MYFSQNICIQKFHHSHNEYLLGCVRVMCVISTYFGVEDLTAANAVLKHFFV